MWIIQSASGAWNEREKENETQKDRVSSATLFSGKPSANVNVLGEWSSEFDKSEDKGSKCAGVQRCRVCVHLNTPPQLELALRPS